MPYIRKKTSSRRPTTTRKRTTRRYPARRRPFSRAVTRREYKVHTTSITENEINSLTSPSGIFTTGYNLDHIGQGVQKSQRIGNQVFARSLYIRGHLYNNSTSTSQYVRIMVVREMDATAGASRLLEGNAGDASSIGGMETIWKRPNKESFRVLANRVYKMSNNDGTSHTRMFKIYIPLYNRIIKWNTTGSDAPVHPIKMYCFSGLANNDDISGLVTEITFQADFYYFE